MTSIKMLLSYDNNEKIVQLPVVPDNLPEILQEGNVYAGTIVVTENGIQFTVTEDTYIDGNTEVPIEAVETGEKGNVDENSITVLVTSNAYVTSITNPEPIEGGTDEETDNALRLRYYLRLQMPATSGNKVHYILWALECPGVGGAKASRDSVVNNKVNLYICGDEGEVVDKTIIDSVQNYIDPNINGDGSDVAPMLFRKTAILSFGKLAPAVLNHGCGGSLSIDRGINAAG